MDGVSSDSQIGSTSGSNEMKVVNGKSVRFADVSSDDVDTFIDAHANKSTKDKTKGHVALLQKFMKEKNDIRNILELSPSEINDTLKVFFVSVRKHNGDEYEPVTLRSMLGSFERHLRDNNYRNGCHSLIRGNEFAGARNALKAKQKNLKAQGRGCQPCKADTPTPQEIQIFYEKKLLGLHNPKSILNSLWFNNTVMFGMRGGQTEHRNLQWGDVSLRKDPIIGEYLELNLERQTKTRTGVDIQNIRKTKPTQHALPNDPEKCPVNLYKFYRSKRPECMMHENAPYYLATVTNNKNPKKNEKWFLAQPVGVNKLKNLMKVMKTDAGLDRERRLTNTSARKHMITTLNSFNVPPTNIMQITGHKNVQSITNYSEVTLQQKKQMNRLLSKSVECDMSSDSDFEEPSRYVNYKHMFY
jgi:hypothetical protein